MFLACGNILLLAYYCISAARAECSTAYRDGHLDTTRCQTAPRALTRAEYEILRDTGRRPYSIPDPTVATMDPISSSNKAHRACGKCSDVEPQLPPIVIVPGFEGSLLATPSANLFLSPLSAASWNRIAEVLPLTYSESSGAYKSASTGTHDARVTLAGERYDLPAADYPAATCAPEPFSRVGHCLPLPATGPVANLTALLAAKYSYQHGRTMFGAPYDWRLPPEHLVRGRWGSDMTALLSSLNRNTLVVAHGYGCTIAAAYLSERAASWRRAHVARLYCLAAPLDGTVSAALRMISGHLPPYEARRTWSSASNADSASRLDFRSVEFELGLRRARRRALPFVPGIWDPGHNQLPPGAAALFRGFGSLMAMLPRKSNNSNMAVVRVGETEYRATSHDMVLLAETALSDPVLARHISFVQGRRTVVDGYELAPGVPVTCVIGTGTETPGLLSYRGTGMAEQLELHEIEMTDGDGVVETRSAMACARWKTGQMEGVDVDNVPKAGHFDLVALARSLFVHLDTLDVGGGSP
jgi:pimeloyl-ACP methyl ester carboxylesterase